MLARGPRPEPARRHDARTAGCPVPRPRPVRTRSGRPGPGRPPVAVAAAAPLLTGDDGHRLWPTDGAPAGVRGPEVRSPPLGGGGCSGRPWSRYLVFIWTDMSMTAWYCAR